MVNLTVTAHLLAHQGGWDEFLWVLVPIAVMVGLLMVATRRVRKGSQATGEPVGGSDPHDVGTE